MDEVIGVTLDEIDGHDWWRKSRRIASACAGHGLHRPAPLPALPGAHPALGRAPCATTPKFGLTRRLYNSTRLGFLERRLLSLNVPQRYALALDGTPPPVEELRPVISFRPRKLPTPACT